MTTSEITERAGRPGKEAKMASSQIQPGTVRWLSANGYPGYTAGTARLAWERMSRFPGLSMAAAVRGGHELALRVEQGC